MTRFKYTLKFNQCLIYVESKVRIPAWNEGTSATGIRVGRAGLSRLCARTKSFWIQWGNIYNGIEVYSVQKKTRKRELKMTKLLDANHRESFWQGGEGKGRLWRDREVINTTDHRMEVAASVLVYSDDESTRQGIMKTKKWGRQIPFLSPNPSDRFKRAVWNGIIGNELLTFFKRDFLWKKKHR